VKTSIKIVAAAALVLTATGALAVLPPGPQAKAQSQPREQQSCFYVHDITNFVSNDDKTLYFSVNNHAVYRLDLVNSCPGLSFRQAINLNSTPSGSSVCSALQLSLSFRETGVRSQCLIRDLHRLTDAEVAALPKRDRP
jgi:hypothetical protein